MELTELRLDNNDLTGIIPSKLSLLGNLTDVRLGGNELEGCIPPPLRQTATHDLDQLGLADCSDPLFPRDPHFGSGATLGWGTYEFGLSGHGSPPHLLVFDTPTGVSLVVRRYIPIFGGDGSVRAASVLQGGKTGILLRSPEHGDAWLFVSGVDGAEEERNPYTGCVYECVRAGSPASLIEQLAASVWVHVVGSDRRWVWP